MEFIPIFILVGIIGLLWLHGKRSRSIKERQYSSVAAGQQFSRAMSKEMGISGYEYHATLSFRTCIVCGVLDGRRYREYSAAPQNIHPGCRCVLLPVTPLSDFITSDRPAEFFPIHHFAENRYNKNHPGKKFSDLSDSTQKKYMREEEKLLPPGTRHYGFFHGNYEKWFFTLPDKYKKVILGNERFDLLKSKKLKLENFVDIKNLREYTLEELYNKYEHAR